MMDSKIRLAVIFGAGIAVAIIAMNVYLTNVEESIPRPEPVEPGQVIDKSNFKMAPDIVGIAEYINTTPEGLEERIKGNVVLYDIWTYSCINCIRTLPFITAWDEKYADQGLLIIGIHSPEFEFEKNPDNVLAAVSKHNIQYPVVMDNDWETWNAFENRYWPRKYIADHEGYIRYDHIGEGAYQETERIIQELLAERAASLQMDMAEQTDLVNIESFDHTKSRTPELYLGYGFARGNQLGNSEGFRPGQVVSYSIPEVKNPNQFYMGGVWASGYESMKLEQSPGGVDLIYRAKEVNIVTAGAGTIEVYLDGKPITSEHAGIHLDGHVLEISESGLYNIITSEEADWHEVWLRTESEGVEIFTFTFG